MVATASGSVNDSRWTGGFRWRISPRARLQRAEAALDTPWRLGASLALDAALVAFEMATATASAR